MGHWDQFAINWLEKRSGDFRQKSSPLYSFYKSPIEYLAELVQKFIRNPDPARTNIRELLVAIEMAWKFDTKELISF